MESERNGCFITIQDNMLEKNMVREKTDKDGNLWINVYEGGGSHFKNWLDQCRDLGEVMVEEIDPKGLKCYEESDEKLYRIWMKKGSIKKQQA